MIISLELCLIDGHRQRALARPALAAIPEVDRLADPCGDCHPSQRPALCGVVIAVRVEIGVGDIVRNQPVEVLQEAKIVEQNMKNLVCQFFK